VHPDDRDRIGHASAEAKPAGFDEEYRILHSDGQVRWIHDRAFPILNEQGEVALLTGIAEDITARKEAEDKLLFLAHHDTLTSLPNRALYQDRLQQAVVQARRARYNVAVVFLDLDHFKLINDTLGHAAGDRLLHQVGLRLKGALRAVDTVGRLGGDEFALVLSELCGPADAEAAVQKLLLRLQEPFDMEGHEVFVTASAGISLYPSDSEQPDALVKYADTAMYRAKELGRTNFQFYNAEMNAKAVERMTLEGQLRRALERGEFALHYQPKVCFRTGAVTGVEALLRWNHPELGMVSPARFISILEDNGLIVPVGEWVLSEVCTQINAWQECGMPISVALNLSGRQLQHKDLERSFNRILLETEVDPHQIELEITESVLMRDAQHAGQVLARLKDLGMRLAIDDFGTGYSSLNYLKRFPLDALKIDRTFVQDLITDADDVAIVEAIVALARTLRLTTIAEGIEGMSQFALLRALGCDEYQGYHFSRPVPADQIPPLVNARVTSLAASEVVRHVHGDGAERVPN
jgi:diguanylate cyclase (GGDEF)-like protein